MIGKNYLLHHIMTQHRAQNLILEIRYATMRILQI